jgi:GNAT superfamily N-acetyltransferase
MWRRILALGGGARVSTLATRGVATGGPRSDRTATMDDVTRRVVAQRRPRFPDPIPGLAADRSAFARTDGMLLRVAYATCPPSAAYALVDHVVRHATARGLGVHWTVVPTLPGEAALPPALLARGFRADESQRLMIHLGPLTLPATGSAPEVTIHRIGTWQEMLVYEQGSRLAFFDDARPHPSVVENRARQRLHDQERGWARYYAAHLDGRPVGGCYLTLYEDIPTVMGVYTIPAAQRRGVATGLLAAVVGELLAEGQPAHCLYVRMGNPAERLYRALGFVPVLDEHTYMRGQSQPAW